MKQKWACFSMSELLFAKGSFINSAQVIKEIQTTFVAKSSKEKLFCLFATNTWKIYESILTW